MESKIKPKWPIWYFNFLSALVYALAVERKVMANFSDRNHWAELMADSQAAMPDYLVWPVRLSTIILDLSVIILTGKRFKSHPAEIRIRMIHLWRHSWKPVQELIRFYDSLFSLCSDVKKGNRTNPIPVVKRKEKTSSFKMVVVGSGPGGAITAEMLKDAGHEVLLLEQGRQWDRNDVNEYSYEEMRFMYRNAGLTPTFGKAKIAYVEGYCLGGGSEINSGLYHRTPETILNHWTEKFGLKDTNTKIMEPHFKWCEHKFRVSYYPGNVPAASLKLEEGARKLGWKVQETPRWFDYQSPNNKNGIKQSMSRTCLKNFEKQGGLIKDGCKVESIIKQGAAWKLRVREDEDSWTIKTERLILSAGALGTPSLLRHSGLSKHAGSTLQMHPTIKVIARFSENVNYERMGVPVHQVRQFAPWYSFGCSISRKPFLKLAMLDHPDNLSKINTDWKKMAIYYAMIIPEGNGSIRRLPFTKDPLVKFALKEKDLRLLSEALKNLCQLLFKAGALELYPSIPRSLSLKGPQHLNRIPKILPMYSSLMTIHLFSSCPMGENSDRTVTDSYGRVWDQKNLWVADSSLLPSAPGVNPQGSLMAFVHRNTLKLMEEL